MSSKQQARPEDLVQIIEAVEETIHVKIPGVFPRWFLEHQGHKLKVWEAIVPAPLYGSPIVCDGVYYTQEAAAHGLLARIAHMETLLRPFFPPSKGKAKARIPLPASLRWLYPMGFESRMRFVAAVKNSLQHRRVTRDGLILASVLRWQEDRGLMLIDPNLSKNIADSYYSTNTLGVTAPRPAAVTAEEPGSAAASTAPKASQNGKSKPSKRKSSVGRPSSSSRKHLARGTASTSAAPSPPAASGAGGTPASESGSSFAEDESIIDILDPEMRLKEHRAVAQALAAQALNTSLSSTDSDAFQAPVANFGVNLDSDDEGSM